MTRNIGRVSALLAPVVVGIVVTVVLRASGDPRLLQVSVSVVDVPIYIGFVLTSLCLVVALALYRRRRTEIRRDYARKTGFDDGVEKERQNHRRFLSRLDHELKNPLTAIHVTVAAAGDGSSDWQTVDNQARKLGTLVRDLRKLADLDNRPLEIESVDLESALVEAIAAIRQQHPEVGERLTLSVTRVPWPVPLVSADLDLIALAVDNVLINAVKYSSHGAIEVRLREQEGWAVIEVADSGRGVPADELPFIFDELSRARNARDVAGSGLGLTLVTTILARHGGDIVLRSVEGAGTVATLRVPVA